MFFNFGSVEGRKFPDKLINSQLNENSTDCSHVVEHFVRLATYHF